MEVWQAIAERFGIPAVCLAACGWFIVWYIKRKDDELQKAREEHAREVQGLIESRDDMNAVFQDLIMKNTVAITELTALIKSVMKKGDDLK